MAPYSFTFSTDNYHALKFVIAYCRLHEEGALSIDEIHDEAGILLSDLFVNIFGNRPELYAERVRDILYESPDSLDTAYKQAVMFIEAYTAAKQADSP